ncbi:hypothetical protein SDC9_212400 [bioreactor metagenome]|uniref:Uncharacterized protein n=1 Tax=bioreactor metagenome TaxID=1076179 RepID=A0A645JYU1_9ZZZZ
MVDDKVHDDADVACPGGVEQGPQVVKRAIFRIDGAVVADVVAEVGVG